MNRRVKGGGWTGFTSLGGGIVGSPSAVTVRESAWGFVRGGDDQVYVNRMTNGQPSGFQLPPGIRVSSRVTAISGFDGDTGVYSVQIFARDRDGYPLMDDPTAFGALFDRHAPAIYRFAAHRLGRGPAEDVLARRLRARPRRAIGCPHVLIGSCDAGPAG